MDLANMRAVDVESQNDIDLADKLRASREAILKEVGKLIVGQQGVLDQVLLSLYVGGNSLILGVPGLAKTMIIQLMAQALDLQFSRIQFTPDLMPSDITGTEILEENISTGKRELIFRPGPIFTNIVLADEINRTPPKTQSALLEAMQEQQVTIGQNTFPLDDPFLVLATQNPIEQEGTYPLPEAQVDRFMLKLSVGYPDKDEEVEILRRVAGGPAHEVSAVVTPDEILRARDAVQMIYMDNQVERYIVELVFATRDPGAHGLADLADLIHFGASPRATINLAKASRAHAFLRRRAYVTPEDVRAVGLDVMRHRVLLTYEAEAEEVTSEDVVTRVLDHIEVP